MRKAMAEILSFVADDLDDCPIIQTLLMLPAVLAMTPFLICALFIVVVVNAVRQAVRHCRHTLRRAKLRRECRKVIYPKPSDDLGVFDMNGYDRFSYHLFLSENQVFEASFSAGDDELKAYLGCSTYIVRCENPRYALRLIAANPDWMELIFPYAPLGTTWAEAVSELEKWLAAAWEAHPDNLSK